MGKLAWAAVAAASLAAAAPASAATIVVTYEGTLFSTYDQDNLFGAGSGVGVLNGLSFLASFTFDTALGDHHDFGTYRYIDGQGAASANIAASITINGHTENLMTDFGVDGYRVSSLYQYDEHEPAAGGLDLVYHSHAHAGIGSDFERLEALVGSFDHNMVDTTDFTSPLTYVVNPGDSASGLFETRRDFGVNIAYGEFNISRVTIARVGAVPEPAAWALMIAGFGFAGFALRRRRLGGVPGIA